MKLTALVLTVFALALAPSPAKAEEESEASEGGPEFNLAFTLGEGVVFIYDGRYSDAYRQQVSFEVVPSFGWAWFKFDLGLYTTLESLWLPDDVGNWNFTFRPGVRLIAPVVPVYLRVAFPLQLQRHNFDWGIMFGVGANIPVLPILGVVLEIDTTLSNRLEWGGNGLPLEFRAGVSLNF